jgi:hypothetical protein
MTISQNVRGAVQQVIQPLVSAVRMNVAAAVRTRRRGFDGWTGAVNTNYDPMDPATATQPFEAYRALHRGGRVHYNPKRATWILSRREPPVNEQDPSDWAAVAA